jgi:hypothetical protein
MIHVLFEDDADEPTAGDHDIEVAVEEDKPIDLGTKVKLDDGSEVTVQELMKAREQLASATTRNRLLEKDVSHMNVLLKEEASPQERATALRHVLEQRGYTEEQIDQYLDITGLGEGEPASKPAGQDSSVGGETEVLLEEIQTLRKEQERAKSEQKKTRVKMLRRALDEALDGTLDKNEKVGVLLGRVKELRSDPGDPKSVNKVLGEARKALRGLLERQTMEQLQLRRAKGEGEFDEEWFGEEAERAVDPVLGVYQSVIGDLSRLGRSPETAAGGASELLSRKPVPPPKWDDKKSVGEVEADIQRWTEDTLMRAAAEGTGTGSSKI